MPHKQFSLREVQSALGVAPVTAERISGLLNGKVNPDNFRSLCQLDPLAQFGIRQDQKVMVCISTLLEGELVTLNPKENTVYIDLGDDDLPTVILAHNDFVLCSINHFCEEYVNRLRV